MSASRCLVISSAFPDGFTGTGYAARSLLPVLAERFERVDYLAIPAAAVAHPGEDAGLPENLVVYRLDADAGPKWRRFLRSVTSPWPASVQRYVRRGVVEKLRDLCRGETPPVVIVLDAPLYWPFLAEEELRTATGPVVLWSQNVLSEAFAGVASSAPFPARLLWKIEIARIERFEKAAMQDADANWAITDDDAAGFRAKHDIECDGVLGIRLEKERFETPIEGDPRTLLYLGSFDVRKRQGIAKFVHEVFPRLRARIPDLRLRLGGRGSEEFDGVVAGVTGCGFVEEADEFLSRGLVVVNPQESGSGIKLKSLHALAAGKVLLTTSVGVQGIPGVDGEHFLLAEGVEEMAFHADTLADPTALLRVAEQGRRFVGERFSPDVHDEVLRGLLAGLDSKRRTLPS